MRLIYLHIDKCGGTSTRNYLRNQFAEHEVCYLEQANFPIVNDHISPSAATLREYRFFHDPYGSFEYHKLVEGCYYFAIFRDPLQRLHSLWRMITRWRDNEEVSTPEHAEAREIAQSGFKNFLDSHHRLLKKSKYNAYARSLCFDKFWLDKNIDTWEVHQSNILSRAMHNLELFSCVGLLDSIPDALSVISYEFDFPKFLGMQNYNVFPADMSELADPAIVKAAEPWVALDHVIYDKVKTMVDKQKNRLDAAQRLQNVSIKYGNTPHYVLFKFDQPIPGYGVQCREINGNKKSAWIGPETTAIFTFNISHANDVRLIITITNFMHIKLLHELKISVNDVKITYRTEKESEHVHAVVSDISSSILKRSSEGTTISLSIPFVVKPDNPFDERELGIELAGIELFPYTVASIHHKETRTFMSTLKSIKREISNLTTKKS